MPFIYLIRKEIIMNEYKSVSKYLNKNKEKFSFKKLLRSIFSKVLICLIIFLIGLIIIKYDNNNKQIIKNFLYKNDISFAKLNSLYEKYIGNILPFESKKNSNIQTVFNEDFTYKDISIYKDGYKVEVDNDYYIPIIESGVVVFIGEKSDYGNTVIIEQTDGVCTYYGNVTNLNVNLYDYVSKGEFLGSSNGSYLYLVFSKDGKFLEYNDYI